MRIREYLIRKNRRYLIAEAILLLVGFAILFVVMLFGVAYEHEPNAAYALAALSILGFLPMFAGVVIAFRSLRCPTCNGRIGQTGRFDRGWRFCPFCAVDLDSVIVTNCKGSNKVPEDTPRKLGDPRP